MHVRLPSPPSNQHHRRRRHYTPRHIRQVVDVLLDELNKTESGRSFVAAKAVLEIG